MVDSRLTPGLAEPAIPPIDPVRLELEALHRRIVARRGHLTTDELDAALREVKGYGDEDGD